MEQPLSRLASWRRRFGALVIETESTVKTRLALFFFLPLFANSTLGLAGPEGRFSVFPKGGGVNPENLTSAICRDWIEFEAGDQSGEIVLWDIRISTDAGSRLLLGANSVYIFALTLSGESRSGGAKAPAGKILVWNHYGTRDGLPQAYTFSAVHLNDVFAANGLDGDPALADLAGKQRRKQFWGLLRPTGFNVATPVSPDLEAVREDYQTNPVIIGIKRNSRRESDYARQTVTAFAEALKAGDARTVALLMSPSLFIEGASATREKELLTDARLAFAKTLVAGGGYGRLETGSVKKIATDQYSVPGGGQTHRITLEAFDDGLYVTQLKSE